MGELLKIEGVEIRAVCDIVESKVAHVQDMVVKAGKPKPEGYSRGETDFRRLCERNDLDLVFTATPWEWHVPVCLAAMNNGKHAATEVPAGRDPGRMLVVGRNGREDRQALRDDGELLLRPNGTDDPEHGPQGPVRRAAARRRRLPARPAGDQVRATAARDCGGCAYPRSATATSIPRTGWGRSRSA